MESLAAFLPAAEGVLPYYMILLGSISIGNSIQAFTTLHFSRRVYNGRFVRNTNLPAKSSTYNPEDSTNKLVPDHKNSKANDQLTPLAGRLFGIWTLLTSMIRVYAAYNLHNGPIYNIAMSTYAVALLHFSSEMFVYKTMTFGLPQFFPFFFATLGCIWMPMVRDSYVQFN
ncbi:putative ERG28-involved in synthesis of ergosterol [Emericellopsis cladophorae]|uniref:ERG28-involved in synthesis of ergosterol n=1 Tax=Emericellopsis cladophorae TaxID=2686198 RepID=A0A9P9Y895_9HYPO|nr:putative ERG28-involved in synthesis of ergosterol [Emericellopsis cladophorae]KAI6784815.1 putative ERG28-involved in synthesis of ergosterol [Emericellopsis cladophorae]